MRASLGVVACLTLAACAATPAPAPVAQEPVAQEPPSGALQYPAPSHVGWDGPLPPTGTPVEDAAAQRLATDLLTGMARGVNVIHEHRVANGPGQSLFAGYTFYEYPFQSNRPGLCRMTVHTVKVTTEPAGPHLPPAPPRASAVDTSERFYLIGATQRPEPPAPVQPPVCSDVPREHFFTAEHEGAAQQAMEALEWGLRWIREGNERAVIVECVSYPGPCDGRRLLMETLTPQRVSAVRWVPCEPGQAPGCWAVSFRDDPAYGGLWTALVRGPQRPMRIQLREDGRPVS